MKNTSSGDSARKWGCLGCVVFICLALAGVVLGLVVVSHEIKLSRQNAAVNSVRTIGFAFFRYASDHGGGYPPGKTSTEMFQALLDENYIKDPALFYAGTPGKSPTQSKQLTPQNVSWDVTFCGDPMASDRMPLVFLTGYNIDYQPGAAAVPTIPPGEITWAQWWDKPKAPPPYMVVYYKNNTVQLLKAEKDGSIPKFIPDQFKAKGRTYLQVKP